MADWLTVDGDDLIPDAFETVIATVLPILEAAETTAEVVKAIVDAIADLLDLPDPAAIIDELIGDIVNSQVSVLYISPQFSRRDLPGGLSKFGRTMTQAFQDNSDFSRPQFEANDTSGGIIFNLNAPSFAEIAQIISLFSQLFGEGWNSIVNLVAGFPGAELPFFQPDFTGTITALSDTNSIRASFLDSIRISPSNIDLFTDRKVKMGTGLNADRLTRISSFDAQTGLFLLDPPFKADLAVGDAYIVSEFKPSRPPDWQSLRLTEVMPPINSLVAVLAAARAQLSPLSLPFGAFIRIMKQIQRVLDQKVLTLQLLINQLQELQAVIDALGELTNINVLPIPFGEGGNGRFIQEFQLAGNAPAVDDDNVSIGVVLYGGSGLTNLFTLLFAPLGF